MTSDVYVDPNVHVDTLLYSALNLCNDPFGSPLTTPSSSRSSSPEPTPLQQLPPEVTVPVSLETNTPIEQEEMTSPSSVTAASTKKRKRRGKKKKLQSAEEEVASMGEREEPPKKQQRSHVQRRKKRNQEPPLFTQSDDTLEELARKHANRLFPSSTHTESTLPANDLRTLAQSTGYQGNPFTGLGNPSLGAPAPEQRIYRLDELVDDGKHNFEVVCAKEDGTSHITCPESNAVLGLVSYGPRKDETWQSNADDTVGTIKQLRPQCKFPDKATGRKGRRGQINNINWGISMGNGQQEPMQLKEQGTKQRKAAVEAIREDPAFMRIALFMSMVFLTWAPKLYLYYGSTISALLEKYPELSLPFQDCVFAAFAVNFGPETVCLPHHDTKNLAFGWCAITALGNYNWRKGGHLVLWDLRLVIEFPPSATIFVPSALICYFNTAIQPDEERYSFTCYTSGALFQLG
ncbi:hypothetical protein V5O48_011856 [Marasmius crinis-equi]|uniref:Uncharacterized protein n=1 Tax=Marasmius crinis-equi TaxID=585013 RepID=A0ABR3F4D9_9AGAR